MKLSKKLMAALNKQVNLEMHAAYTYKGMEQYFREEGYPQYAHFFNEHTKEELKHAGDFKTFIEEVDGHVEFMTLEGVPTEYASPKAALEAAMDHEKMISASIISILEIAIEEKHYAAENFLRTYVDEQVEEEDLFRSVMDAMKHAGEKGAAHFNLGQILKHEHEED
jgi:ferritin